MQERLFLHELAQLPLRLRQLLLRLAYLEVPLPGGAANANIVGQRSAVDRREVVDLLCSRGRRVWEYE